MESEPQDFLFGPYCLVKWARLLLRDGEPVPIGSRAFDLLATLVESRDTVVSRAELLQRVWAGGRVHENNLPVHISALRKALGDDETGQRYIATVTRRGFRFVAPVALEATRFRQPAAIADAPGGLARGNVPPLAAGLIGRADETATIAAELRQAALVSIIGPSGIGKTSLARAVAIEESERFADGVWLVDLAALTDGADLPAAAATTLALPMGAGDITADNVALRLRNSRLLLVLDNCEHLRAAAAALAGAILATCPAVTILTTGLERLGLPIERVVPIGPLAVPPAEPPIDARGLFDFAASALFIERAKAVDRLFAATDRNAGTIADICRSLDGVPLAIELAASRHSSLGLEQIRRGLADRFALLVGGSAAGTPRHRTLAAAQEWSYFLLTPHEQAVLRRLSLFVGGFDLPAAEALVDGPAEADLARLVERSLVVLDRKDPEPRYRLLDSTRLHAAEKLTDASEAVLARRRHAEHYTAVLEREEHSWENEATSLWQNRLLPDLANLRAALDWCFGPDGDAALGQRLCAASLRLWHGLSLTAEYRLRLERAMAYPIEGDDALAARLFLAAARSVLAVASRGEAAERAVSLARAAGDRRTLGRALAVHGDGRRRSGDVAAAEAALTEAVTLLRAADTVKSCGEVLQQLAIIRFHQDDVAESRRLNADAMLRFRATGHDTGLIACLVRQANDDIASGRIAEAVAATSEAVSLSRALRNRYMLELTLGNLASFEALRGNWPEAGRAAREALPIALDIDDRAGVAAIAEILASVAAAQNRPELAACILGHSEAFYRQDGEAREPNDQAGHERLTATLAALLDAEALAACRQLGESWTDEILRAAIGQLHLSE